MQHTLCVLLVLILSWTGTSAQNVQQKGLDHALQELNAHPETYQLTQEALQEYKVSSHYSSSHNQVTHIYLQQTWQGIDVRGAVLSGHWWNGRLVGVHHRFVDNPASVAGTASPSLSAEEAIDAAATHVDRTDYSSVILLARPQGAAMEARYQVPGLSNEPIPVKLSWVLSENGFLRLAWELRIYSTDYQHWWGIWVDAETGVILDEDDWVVHCNWSPEDAHNQSMHHLHSHQMAAKEKALQLYAPLGIMATPSYRVFPLPVESPSHGNRALLTDPSDPDASPFGWHDTDGVAGEEYTITRGNNVWAQDDIDGNNGTGASPDGGASLMFDFPLPSGVTPITYLDASTTNLFVWNNIMHDVWYQYGFDEVSGNFQANNYGKGGEQGDFVFADAQDGGGLNNANFATPGDGTPGRMQMYLWRSGGGGSIEYLTINSPVSIAGGYSSAVSTFGPAVPPQPITADLVLVIDSAMTSEACSSISNDNELDGKIAVVYRGNCTFTEKVERCQAAGALAVVVVNNQPTNIFSPGGFGPNINIPSVMIGQADGTAILNELSNGPVNGSLANPGNPNDRDGSFDNGVVAHEYGHGISTRLTGGPAISCLNNQEQAGEGWSDFFSLVMTTDSTFQGTDVRGIGTFAINQPTTGNGIRDYPYSTNMIVSPYTYDDIKTMSIPHGVGSVMCAMLWDLYWKMAEQYGYDNDLYHGTGGNNMAMQLVIDGLKLQPCQPGFVDVRDAILLADQINYGGMNQCLIWEVFARRGLGYSADQGSPGDRGDGVSAFDLPPACLEILYMEKTTEALTAEAGSQFRYRFFVKNLKDTVLTQLSILDTLPDQLVYVANSANLPATVNGQIVELVIDSLQSGEEFIAEFDVTVSTDAKTSAFVFEDDMEGQDSDFLPSGQLGTDGWVLDTLNPRSGSYAWFVPNAEATNDQVLTLPLGALTTPVELTFWHSFRTESGYDGGVIEILPTQTSGNWTDLGPFIIENGYTTSLATNNPLGAVQAFSGNSNGYVKTTVDLSAFLGQQLFIRFRFVSDDNTSSDGWWVDDIRIGLEEALSNKACVTAAEGDRYCSEQLYPTLIKAEGTSTAIDDPASAPLKVTLMPNPATNEVRVNWDLHSATPVRITLRNMLGQALITRNSAPGEQMKTLNLASVPAGVYLVEVTDGTGRSVHRLVVE